MKKFLKHLTGIVFVITILIAGSCRTGDKQNGSTTENNGPAMGVMVPTQVDVYLNAILLDGQVHLLMYDSKKPDCEVMDNLFTVVNPGNTVKWQKVKDSKIDEIIDVQLVKADSRFEISSDGIGVMRSFKIDIPDDADTGTIKYEVEFTTTLVTDTSTIDPYLRIED